MVIFYEKLFARVFLNSQKNPGDESKAANVFTVKLQVLLKLEVVPTSKILLKKKVPLQVLSYEFGTAFKNSFFCKRLHFRTAAFEEVKNITSYPHDNLHQLNI